MSKMPIRTGASFFSDFPAECLYFLDYAEMTLRDAGGSWLMSILKKEKEKKNKRASFPLFPLCSGKCSCGYVLNAPKQQQQPQQQQQQQVLAAWLRLTNS